MGRSAEHRYAIGIDLGGTKTAGGLVDLHTGEVSHHVRVATPTKGDGNDVAGIVVDMVRAIKASAETAGTRPAALGIGVAELVGPDGAVLSGYRIPWKGRDIAAEFSTLLPTTLEADVRAAAQAEARFGQGLTDFYFVSIGTGTSGVLVQNGRAYAGSRGAALVIGNGPSRHRCPSCGHVDCLIVEDIASGPGLAVAYGAGSHAEDVLVAAASGDARATDVIAQATAELGRVLALLAGALNPQAVIIGGGLGAAPGIFHDRLKAAIMAGLWADDDRALPILRAATGVNAGVIGAALATLKTKEPEHRPVSSAKTREGVMQ